MMMSDIRQTRTCYPIKVAGNAGRRKGGKNGGEVGVQWEWRAVGWQGYKIRIYVCIASRILDPLSQESAVLEMELFESSFQPRLHVQTVSRSKSKTWCQVRPIIFFLAKSSRF